MRPSRIKIGKTYSSKNCGDFKVIAKDYDRSDHDSFYFVEFEKTKYVTSTRQDNILSGYIKDPYFPRIHGVGYLGAAYGTKIDNTMYTRWEKMLGRCYDPGDSRYNNYGGAGVAVCERWHCYAYFIEDVPNLPGYDDMINNPHTLYHLDKDTLQMGIPTNQKVYSPTTCMFIPANMNISQIAADHRDDYKANYYSVYKDTDVSYRVELQINNMRRPIGRYADEIVAANASNHARRPYGLPLNTGIPYIPPEEVNALNMRKHLAEMCSIVKKEMVKIINK